MPPGGPGVGQGYADFGDGSLCADFGTESGGFGTDSADFGNGSRYADFGTGSLGADVVTPQVTRMLPKAGQKTMNVGLVKERPGIGEIAKKRYGGETKPAAIYGTSAQDACWMKGQGPMSSRKPSKGVCQREGQEEESPAGLILKTLTTNNSLQTIKTLVCSTLALRNAPINAKNPPEKRQAPEKKQALEEKVSHQENKIEGSFDKKKSPN